MSFVRSGTRLGLVIALAAAAFGCDVESVIPSPTPPPPGSEAEVWIDQSWTQVNGIFTFTGGVIPDGLSVRVVLEIGSGPAGAPSFREEVLVAEAVTVFTPLTVRTALPEVGETCVRFTISTEVEHLSSRSICFGIPRRPVVSPKPSG